MSAVGPPPRIWFIDTASLLSMAVDGAIAAVVLDTIGDDRVVIIDVVTDELRYRATVAGTAGLARTALATMPSGWTAMDTALYVTLDDVLDAQWDVADGRPLKDERQHWAESTIIALGRRAAAAGGAAVKVLMSEDYDARRVAAAVPNMTGVSLHGLFHHAVHVEQSMTPVQAAALAKMLQDDARAEEVTAEEFADATGRGLGRVGSPRPRL